MRFRQSDIGPHVVTSAQQFELIKKIIIFSINVFLYRNYRFNCKNNVISTQRNTMSYIFQHICVHMYINITPFLLLSEEIT